jgi:hypothetical protein
MKRKTATKIDPPKRKYTKAVAIAMLDEPAAQPPPWVRLKAQPPIDGQTVFEQAVQDVLNEVGSMLSEKNRKYGNAALAPIRVFSRLAAIEQIKVRLDDKITRLKNMQSDEDEDVERDLIGYLVLLRIAKHGMI